MTEVTEHAMKGINNLNNFIVLPIFMSLDTDRLTRILNP